MSLQAQSQSFSCGTSQDNELYRPVSIIDRPDRFSTIAKTLTGSPCVSWNFEAITLTSTPLIPVQPNNELRLKIQEAIQTSFPSTPPLPLWVNVSHLLYYVAIAGLGPEDRFPLEFLAMRQLERIAVTRVDYQPTGHSSRFWAMSTLCAILTNNPSRKVYAYGQEWTLIGWNYTESAGTHTDTIHLDLENNHARNSAKFSWEELKRWGNDTFSLQWDEYFSHPIFG